MHLKIASYNIHKALGTDGRRDPARILGVLNALDADVVVLQEADRRMGARPSVIPRFLIDQHTDYKIVEVAGNDLSLGWHGNAAFVRRSLPLGRVQSLELPGLEPRGAILFDVAGITVVGTHLGLLRLWRRRQMHAIAEHLKGIEQRTVIAGDFNEWSNLRGYEPWQKDFSLVLPGASFPAVRPLGYLDGFFCGAGLNSLDSGIDKSSATRLASDHLPVWLRVDAQVSGLEKP